LKVGYYHQGCHLFNDKGWDNPDDEAIPALVVSISGVDYDDDISAGVILGGLCGNSFMCDLSKVNSGYHSLNEDDFDWEALNDDGGRQSIDVQNSVLRRFLAIHSNEKATEWLVAKNQARTDRVTEIMLEIEVELHLLITSIFDRLSRSESGDVATAFEMYERLKRDCAKNIYYNNSFRCVLPKALSDVKRLYLRNKYDISSNIPCPTIHEIDGRAYVSIRKLLAILLEIGKELDYIIPLKYFPEIHPYDPVSRLSHTHSTRKIILSCNETYKVEDKKGLWIFWLLKWSDEF
jgi:hypothetical protein